MTPEIIHWAGRSGQQYAYHVFPIGTTFTKAPGNYVFAKEVSQGRLQALYVGETGDLSTRFDYHHKMDHIRYHGATHICAHVSPDNVEMRLREEEDLIAGLRPPCNG